MDSLRTLQKNFQAYMLTDNPQQKKQLRNIVTEIALPPNGVAQERLDVYREGYSIRLIEILANDFPVLMQLMGAKAFKKIAERYVLQTQSRHYSVMGYGQHLNAFLKQQQVHQSFSEMAEFEWALAQASVSKPDAMLTVSDLSTIAAEHWLELRFKFHPSVSRHRFYYNVGPLWRAYTEAESPPRRSAKKKPLTWLVWCLDNAPYYCCLDRHQVVFFNALDQGATFEAACEVLCEHMSATRAGQFAGFTLRNWVESGLIMQR